MEEYQINNKEQTIIIIIKIVTKIRLKIGDHLHQTTITIIIELNVTILYFCSSCKKLRTNLLKFQD